MHKKSGAGFDVKVKVQVKFKISQSLRYTHICLSCTLYISQSLRYTHICLSHVTHTLIKMSTINPSHKSMVLESSVKPSQAYQFGMLGLV